MSITANYSGAFEISELSCPTFIGRVGGFINFGQSGRKLTLKLGKYYDTNIDDISQRNLRNIARNIREQTNLFTYRFYLAWSNNTDNDYNTFEGFHDIFEITLFLQDDLSFDITEDIETFGNVPNNAKIIFYCKKDGNLDTVQTISIGQILYPEPSGISLAGISNIFGCQGQTLDLSSVRVTANLYYPEDGTYDYQDVTNSTLFSGDCLDSNMVLNRGGYALNINATVNIYGETLTNSFRIDAEGIREVQYSVSRYARIDDDLDLSQIEIRYYFSDKVDTVDYVLTSWQSSHFSSCGEKIFTALFSGAVTYNDEEITINSSITFGVIVEPAISLSSVPERLELNVFDEPDFSNLKVYWNYEHFQPKQLLQRDYFYWPFNETDTTGIKTLRITSIANISSGQESLYLNIEVLVNGLESIYVKNLPNKLYYLLNEEHDFAGLQVMAVNTKGEETDITNVVSLTTNNTGLGIQYVNLSYEERNITKTAFFTIFRCCLDNLTLDISNIRSRYFVIDGIPQEAQLNGLKVYANFTNGMPSRELDTNEYCVQPFTPVEGINNVIITATIDGVEKQSSFQIEYLNDTPESVLSVTFPNENNGRKHVYSYGEFFDKSTVSVQIKMASGETMIIDDFYCSLEGAIFGTDIVERETNIIVRVIVYNEGVAEILEYVSDTPIYYDSVESMELLDTPKTIYKVGETVDLTGVTARVTYASGITKTTEVETDLSTPFSLDDVGETSINIFAKNDHSFHIVLPIEIIKPVSLQVTHADHTYKYNDKLIIGKLNARLVYSNGSEEAIPNTSLNIPNIDMPLEGNTESIENQVNVSYEGVETLLSTFTVKVKRLKLVEIVDPATRVAITSFVFNKNENISFANYCIHMQFNDNTDEYHSISEINYLDFHNCDEYTTIIGKRENCYITANHPHFGSKSTDFFNIHCRYLKSTLRLEETELFSNKNWFDGEIFTNDNYIVSYGQFLCTDGTSEAEIEVEVEPIHVRLIAGINNIDFVYRLGEQVARGSITINASSIMLTRLEQVGNAYASLNYVETHHLVMQGLTSFQAVYNNGPKIINYSLCDFYLGETKIDPVGYQLRATDNGKQLIVKYTDPKDDTNICELEIGTLSVQARVLDDIRVSEDSTHTTEFYYGEYFNLNGLVIELHYNSDEEGIYSEIKRISVDNIEVQHDLPYEDRLTVNEHGEHEITISYGGLNTTIVVEVVAPTLTDIEIDETSYIKSIKNGMPFSLDSLVIYCIYHNGHKILADDFATNISELGILNANGEISTNDFRVHEITVTVGDVYVIENRMQKAIYIDIRPNAQLTGIRLEPNGEGYKDYYVGETFNAHDIKVYGAFKDIGENEIADYTTVPALGSVLREAGKKEITVYVNDNGIICSAKYDILVNIKTEKKYTDTCFYAPVFNIDEIEVNGFVLNEEELGFPLVLLYEKKYIGIDQNGRNYLIDLNDKAKAIGYLDFGNDVRNATLVLFDDYTAPVMGENNIEVKFPHYIEGNADIINNCHFGTMFGNNNSMDKLFISGNTKLPNFDWHSGEVDTESVPESSLVNGNFAYFEDDSLCKYGETDNKIVGYDIVSNDKLLVLKDKSDKETSIYFRTPQMVGAVNASGYVATGIDGETLYKDEFSRIKGNSSVGGISHNSIINFNGDTLFLSSDNQLVGLDLVGIIGDNQRYANSRSYFIDRDLQNQDLSNSFLWSNNKYLFLVLPNKIYVTHFEAKNSNNQYEWWLIDVENVTSIIEISGVIYFAQKDGVLCKFNNNWNDCKKVFVDSYDATFSEGENGKYSITISEQLGATISEDKTYLFNVTSSNLYYEVFSMAKNGADFTYDDTIKQIVFNGSNERLETLRKHFGEKDYFFINYWNINQTSNPSITNRLGRPMILESVVNVDGRDTFKIVDKTNKDVLDPKELFACKFCKKISGRGIITNLSEDHSTFDVIYDDEIINVIPYGTQGVSNVFKLELCENKAVEAFYISAPLLASNLEYFKTIWSITLTNDTNIPSELELCYATNKIPYADMKTLAKISKDVLGFDFDKFNFSKVDFSKYVVPRTYTSKRILSGIKFLCVGFKNYNDTNSVLSSMQLVYTLPYPSYGGD